MLRIFHLNQWRKNLSEQFHSIKRYLNKMNRNEDNRLDTFRRVCDEIAAESSYLNKVKVLQNFLKKGSDKMQFKGDMLLWVQMLIPSASQRVYNLQNKQMLKLFSRIFACDLQQMQSELKQDGDVSVTLRKFFESSTKLKPQSQSALYLQDVDEFLINLEQKTKEDEQTDLLQSLCKQLTALDLDMVIRLIKQDLRIDARARHILDAFGPNAYPAYQTSRDLAAVVKEFAPKLKTSDMDCKKPSKSSKKEVGHVQVMTPISPMLANACKSIEEAFNKNPSGLYSEIKYDGERVQIHKSGKEFKYFSRNLKPVMEHKIKRFKEFIPKAFPGGGDMILDSEIILVDKVTGELLPFGSLGAHKQKEYANAEVCLFVFDCILFNGEDLTKKIFRERRQVLEQNINVIKSYVQLSECQFLKTKYELAMMTAKVLKANLEGVVLKSPTDTYQPGKRGWLKVKKDYLFGGRMADTADLVVLGAWFGSGKKGGTLSIFLMGCLDPRDKLWKTVTKVHSGLDDITNKDVHENFIKLMVRADSNKLPNWLHCKSSLVPDYVAREPIDMPVWEITGAEFTKSETHTAGISIRFPRITKLRDDKSANEANDLVYLQKLYDASKNNVNVDLLIANCDDNEIVPSENAIKINGNQTPKKGINTIGDVKLSQSSVGKSKRSARNDDKNEINDQVARSKHSHKKLKIDNTPKKKENQLKIDSLLQGSVRSNKETQIFKDMIAYFDKKSTGKDNFESLFISNGGIVTTDTKKANFSFYRSMNPKISLEYCRENYKSRCRHLNEQWIQDSIKEKQIQPYPLYAVVLKT